MPHGSVLHIPPTNLLLLAAKQESDKKAYLLTKHIEEFSGKSLEEWTSRQKKKKKRYDRKSNSTRKKNMKGDSKVESNDSPGIPDRGGDIRHPWPPFGVQIKQETIKAAQNQIPWFKTEAM